MHEMDVRPSLAALLMPAAYFGSLATSVGGGALSDRFGGRPIAALGLALIASGVTIAGLAPTFVIYLAGALVTGTGYGIANPATSVLVNSVTIGGRGLQLGIKQAGVTLGGLVVGLALPPIVGLARWFVALFALAGCVVLVAVWLFRGGTRSDDAAATVVDPVWEPVALRPFSGGVFGFAMSSAQVASFGLLAVYLVDRLHMSPARASVVFGLVLGTGVLSRIGWSAMSDWSFRRRTERPWRGRVLPLRMCATIGLAGFVSMTIPTPSAAVLGAFLLGVGAAGWNGAYLAAVMPSGVAGGGRTVGRALMFINVGCMVGPLLAGAVLAGIGRWDVMWAMLAALQVLALTTARAVRSV